MCRWASKMAHGVVVAVCTAARHALEIRTTASDADGRGPTVGAAAIPARQAAEAGTKKATWPCHASGWTGHQRPTLAWQRGCGWTAATWLRGEGQLGRHSISARNAGPETGVAWRSPVLRAHLRRQLGQRPKPRWGRRPRLDHPGDRIVWWWVSTDRTRSPPENPRATQARALTYRCCQLGSTETERKG